MADGCQPSSDEAKKLHDLMLQVTDEKLDKLDGEAVVPMKDTEVCVHVNWRERGSNGRSKRSSSCSPRTGTCTAKSLEVYS